MSKTAKWIIGALVLALLAGVAGFFVWRGAEGDRQRRALAERLASNFSALKADPNDFLATAGADPAASWATWTRGLAGQKPAVTVRDVTARDDQYADAVLHYAWKPIPSKEAWEYDVTVPLQRTADGWKASWAASNLAPGLKDDEKLVYNRLLPARGAVLGQGGGQIAFNQPAIRVGVDKAQVDEAAWDSLARLLAKQLTEAGLSVNADSYAAKVKAAGPKAFIEAAVLRVSDAKQAALATELETARGIRQQKVTRALGLNPSFLRPILGQVGEANAEAVAASHGELVAGDQVGTGGLQAAQDRTLRGSAGYVFQALQTQGAQARDLKRVTAVDGTDVNLTIDVGLQQAAETVLAGVKPASALVAIRPSDGAVLAAASGPGGGGLSTATLGLFEPGSTFKTVSGLALLRKNSWTPTSTVNCPETLTVEGYTFHNDEGYPAYATGPVSLTKAFAQSCNTVFLAGAEQVSPAELREAAAGLGVTGEPVLGVSASFGQIPQAPEGATKKAASMIGQGDVRMTPLGMAVVTASIGKGAPVAPRLLTGATTASPAPSASGATIAHPVTTAEAGALKTLMRAVVTEGTAQKALAGTPGGELAAKTGTATYEENGQKRYHTWLIALQGDLAVAVMVADGDFGASTCGPIMKQFLTANAAG